MQTREAQTLQRVDEWLLLVLRIPPSEIDALDMEDYWRWFEAAQAHQARMRDD